MESDQAINEHDAGSPIAPPVLVPSALFKGLKALGGDRASENKIAIGHEYLDTYLMYCKDFLDLNQYPTLPEQDRAVISDFISGELLENDQWKHLFASGNFECILNTTPGPETDEYSCTEYTVFKINFERISCSKDIRRVWTLKGKSKIDDLLSGSKRPSGSNDSCDSQDRDGRDFRNGSFELQSPIKQAPKRRTPTRRRSFEERDRRRSSSRATKTPAKRGRPAKKATPGRPKKASVPKKKQVENVSDETWEVLSIRDCKKKYGKYQYLVQWAGLDPEGKPWDDTWEPAGNVSEDLIRHFWQHNRDADKKALPSSDTPTKDADEELVSIQNLLTAKPAA